MPQRSGTCVVMPVIRPTSLPSLVPVAAAMAAGDDGRVVPVTVVDPHTPGQAMTDARELALEAERLLRRAGVPASGVVAEAASVPEGVRSVLTAEGATLVVMGWRGRVDVSHAFDATVDDVVGRSSVPLLVVRPSDRPIERIVLPLTAAHVAGRRSAGLDLATTLVRRLVVATGQGVGVLWAGDEEPDVPEEVRALAGRLHHDPRRLDEAIGSMARAGDVLVASVAPTAASLREVTTHLSSATPDATLVVAIDSGPTRSEGLGAAVADQVTSTSELAAADPAALAEYVVTVSVDPLSGSTISRRRLVRALAHVGSVSEVDVHWLAATRAQRLRVQVRLPALGSTAALGEVMSALHDAPDLGAADLSYAVERFRRVLRLPRLDPMGSVDP